MIFVVAIFPYSRKVVQQQCKKFCFKWVVCKVYLTSTCSTLNFNFLKRDRFNHSYCSLSFKFFISNFLIRRSRCRKVVYVVACFCNYFKLAINSAIQYFENAIFNLKSFNIQIIYSCIIL